MHNQEKDEQFVNIVSKYLFDVLHGISVTPVHLRFTYCIYFIFSVWLCTSGIIQWKKIKGSCKDRIWRQSNPQKVQIANVNVLKFLIYFRFDINAFPRRGMFTTLILNDRVSYLRLTIFQMHFLLNIHGSQRVSTLKIKLI